jgi:hexosaminidase
MPPVSGTGLWAPAEALGAGRAAQVAGVEAAVWAETIANFDDLSFLLLPRRGRRRRQGLERLAGRRLDRRPLAARPPRPVVGADDLTYFRTSTVNWL